MGRGGKGTHSGWFNCPSDGQGLTPFLFLFCFPFSGVEAEARRPAPGTVVHRYLSSKPAVEFKYVEATPGWERADCWVYWTQMDLPHPEKVD